MDVWSCLADVLSSEAEIFWYKESSPSAPLPTGVGRKPRVPPVSPLPLGEGPGVRATIENTVKFLLQYLFTSE